MMSRAVLFIASLLLMSAGASICVAQCTEDCTLVEGSLHADWNPNTNIHELHGQRWADKQGLNVWSNSNDGGNEEHCKADIQWRWCKNGNPVCPMTLPPQQEGVAEASLTNCNNQKTYTDERNCCRQPKQPECHCEAASFPPDHDV